MTSGPKQPARTPDTAGRINDNDRTPTQCLRCLSPHERSHSPGAWVFASLFCSTTCWELWEAVAEAGKGPFGRVRAERFVSAGWIPASEDVRPLVRHAVHGPGVIIGLKNGGTVAEVVFPTGTKLIFTDQLAEREDG